MPTDHSNALGSGAYGFHARSLSQAYLLGELAQLLELKSWPGVSAEDVRPRVEALWHSVVELLGLTPAERAIALEGPPPDSISLSGGVPVARWAAKPQGDPWRRHEVIFVDTDRSVSVCIAFRPAAKVDFPDGTVFMEIQDPHHSAQACSVELIGCMRRDVDRVVLDPDGAWRKICELRAWYGQVGRSSIDILPRDHYRDWNPSVDAGASPLDMAKVVSERAATQIAQRNISMAIAARWFGRESASIEAGGNGSPTDWARAMHSRLATTEALLRGALAASNDLLLAFGGCVPEEYSSEVVFASEADGLPTVAAVPLSAVKPPIPLMPSA